MFIKNKALVTFFLAVIFFIFMSFVATLYEDEIKLFVGQSGSLGAIVYVLITILAIVVAPISTISLIPVASHLWGFIMTAILSIIGWVIGAQIAFYIARYFGRPFVEKFFSIEKLDKFKKIIPKHNIFWTVVFFRMAVPVDMLSYAIGIFSKMNGFSYFLATLIGVTPFAFVFSYAGTFPIELQIIALLAGFVIFFISYLINKFHHNE